MPTVLWAQTTIKVGDFVYVNRATTHYSTGESISPWVYNEPHQVSQINSKFHPNCVLLNIRGANSWLGADDVTLCVPQNQAVSAIVENNDSLVLHDTIINYVEQIKEVIITDTIFQTDTVKLDHLKSTVFQFDASAQAAYGDNLNLGFHVTVGGRFSDAFFLGLGAGFEGSLLKSIHTLRIPIYANARCYFPIKEVSPFIDIAAGVNVHELDVQYQLNGKDWKCGLYTRAGIGVEYKRLLVGVGYQFSGGDRTILENNIHQGYVKIGCRFANK